MSTTTDKTVTSVRGPGVPVRGNDIDTDQIIPARFMKEVTFDNMGDYAFYDARRDDDGNLNDHAINRHPNGEIMVVNQNFGCGSSREHAPQALMRWGIKGLVGESFAEIFAGNCQALGLPTATADHETIAWIMEQVESDPTVELTIDVDEETVAVGDETVEANVSDAQREALLQGVWDTTALMKSFMDEVRETADSVPYLNGFAECWRAVKRDA